MIRKMDGYRLSIPHEMLKEINIRKHEAVRINVEGDKIVITKPE